MGEGEGKGEKGGCIRRRDYNTTTPRSRHTRTKIAGLDPAPRSPTGYAVAEVYNDDDSVIVKVRESGEAPLWEAIMKVAGAIIIAVDAPLSIPYKGFRRVERRIIREVGARLLPGGLPGMRRLSQIGYSIKQLFEEAGSVVLETHPGTQKRIFAPEGILGKSHEGDAFLAMIVAASYYACCSMCYEDESTICFASPECGKIIKIRYGWEDEVTS